MLACESLDTSRAVSVLDGYSHLGIGEFGRRFGARVARDRANETLTLLLVSRLRAVPVRA